MATAISFETYGWPTELLCDDDDLAGDDLELRAMDQAEAYAAYVEAEVLAMAEEDDDPGYDVEPKDMRAIALGDGRIHGSLFRPEVYTYDGWA